MAYNVYRGNADGGDEGWLVDDDGDVIECYECNVAILVEGEGEEGPDNEWRCDYCHSKVVFCEECGEPHYAERSTTPLALALCTLVHEIKRAFREDWNKLLAVFGLPRRKGRG